MTGPATRRYVGTQAEFHVSMVLLQTVHSKPLIWRPEAMDSVRV